jgi:phosphoglycerate dehydrogenase-like enzyme
VARRASGFGLRVLAARRGYTPGQRLPFIDELYPRERLHEMLRLSDFVVVAVSLTKETTRMIGEPELRAMKPGCFFMNVSRGGTVDQPALVRALKSGHLGGAGIDVFDPEPLPSESELWGLPNVIITPHNSGGVREHSKRATELFCENLRRYIRGEPLENVIDPAKGY